MNIYTVESTYPTAMYNPPSLTMPLSGTKPLKASFHTGDTLTSRATKLPSTVKTSTPIMSSKSLIDLVTIRVGSGAARKGERHRQTLIHTITGGSSLFGGYSKGDGLTLIEQ
jgi:hypothetical protein